MFHYRSVLLALYFLLLVFIAAGPLTSCIKQQELTISIRPAHALYGTPFSMTISGLNPGEHAVLKARSIDGVGTFWDSEATFKADQNGAIDLSSQSPISGDYSEADVMGMLWAMQPSNSRNKVRPYVAYEHGISVEFTLTDSKSRTAAAMLGRYYQMPDTGIVRIPLDANGCKGFLYYPEKGGPFPGLILLGGSGGGMSDSKARTLASHGFATLALAYFRYPGLPGYLIEIPMEYFKGAIDWMKTRQVVQKGKLGLVGYSKGGECSLLLASLYDEFSAVAAMVPSAFVWKDVTPLGKSSWTLAGKPLPFISTKETEEEVQQFMRRELTSIRKWYASRLAAADSELVKKARIPVENIKAPVFFASDRDDQTWPSAEFCETIVQNLKTRHFPFEYKHICRENAGHHVCWPDFIPGIDRGVNAGNPKDKVKWSFLVWKEMLSFLHKHLDAPSRKS